MTLYFAYGSNMCHRQMKARCPDSVRLGQAVLAGYRWFIASDGFASVCPSGADSVEGTLYDVSESDEVALDSFEEVSADAYRKCVYGVTCNSCIHSALIYINTLTEEGKAGPEYSQRILEGAADAGLSPDYVNRFIRQYLYV